MKTPVPNDDLDEEDDEFEDDSEERAEDEAWSDPDSDEWQGFRDSLGNDIDPYAPEFDLDQFKE